MNECERFEELLSAYLDGELPEAEEAELRAHLDRCPDCAAMYEAFSAVGEAVRTQDVPDTLHSRIMETVHAAEKASRTQRAIIRLRPILAAAACLIVLVGTVFALRNTVRFDRGAMKSADASTPMAANENAAVMATGPSEAAAESVAENGALFESKMEMPAAAKADMAIAESAAEPGEPQTNAAALDTDKANAPADAAFFADADAVIAQSALIARVEKTGEEPASQGGTVSHVTVQEVVQCAAELPVEAGSAVDVLESGETDGYRKMETGKQYLLFLDYDPANDCYEPVSPLCGKLPTDPEEPLLSDGGDEQAERVLTELQRRFLPDPGE